MNEGLKLQYREWQAGLAAAEIILHEEQAKYLTLFDQHEEWKIVNDLIRMGLAAEVEPRNTSGLLEFQQMMQQAFGGRR